MRGVIIYGLILAIVHLFNIQKNLKLLKYKKIQHLIKKLMLYSIQINSFGLVLIRSRFLVI